MKASNATSARATAAPRPTAPSSARRPPTLTSANGFALTGTSDAPDPQFHAYRKDLADVALAGRVVASHYAEPVNRLIVGQAVLRALPTDRSEEIGELDPGEPFALLDDSLGWSWGYAGQQRRVGYVRSSALTVT